MPAITLDEFCNQWARGKDVRPFHSLLAKNAEDFVTLAGEYALSRFRTSFAEGGFYGSGTKWAPRTSKWGKKFTHPVLIDSGELKSKIKGQKSELGAYSAFGKRTTADATITTSGRKKKVRPWRGIVERKKENTRTTQPYTTPIQSSDYIQCVKTRSNVRCIDNL